MHRYSFTFLLALIPLLHYSQSMQYCPIEIGPSIYQIFNDSYGYFEEEIILMPVYKNDTSNVSSYQFNINYNPNVINFENDYLSTVNSSLFYSTTNIDSSSSDTNNGGVFAYNTFEITDSLAMTTIVYATSNLAEINSTLLYVPISILSEGCSDLNFTNGYFKGC